jgi:hypothetical protein
VSGDSSFSSATGSSGFALEFFDGAGASLGLTSNLTAGTHDFMNDQARRNGYALEVLAPPAAVRASAVFTWSGFTGAGEVGVRYVKGEQGRFPVTPYTSEASDRGAVAAVRDEITARTTAVSAEAAARSTLAARVNGAEAAISTEASVRATDVGNLQARWGIKMDVSGKVSGVLMNNDGSTSDFIVLSDRFAVATAAGGTTKYPFVVGSVAGASTVGIDGTLVVDGTILARAINVDRLSAITARLGYVTAGQVDINGNGFGDWGYIRSYGKWLGDGQWGWVMARHATGDTFIEFNVGGMGLQMHNADGSFRFWGPGFNLDNGGLTISQINVIDTLNIRGSAITIPAGDSSGSNSISIPFNVPGSESISVFISGTTFIPATGADYGRISVDGVDRWIGAGVAGSTVAGSVRVDLAPGGHTLRMYTNAFGFGLTSSIFALGVRR